MKKMNKKGFTIVELVIVIAVIGILAAVLIPTFSGIVEKANASARLQEARNSYVEYLAAHPSAEIAYVEVVEDSTSYYYDVNDDYALEASKPTDGTILTIGTGLKDICSTKTENGTTCDECGWTLPTN